MKLFDIYKKIEANNSWRYYEHANLSLNIDTISKNEESVKFVTSYLDAGGKIKLLSGIDSKVINALPNNRATHIVSTYLLGIYLKDKLSLKISEDLCIIKDYWLYVWFLTCLYHDIGYVYEDDKSYLEKDIGDFLSETVNINTCEDLKYYNLGKKYFDYRKAHGKIDHGVVGGFRLYSILRNIYENVLKTNRDQLHVFKGLSYSPELYKFHKIAADAIIRHNMWLATPNNIYDYKKYDLYDLIESVGKDNKIDITNEQFTFLLGLCDTIEPIKRFSDIDAAFVLNHINLQVVGNKIEISTDYPLKHDRYYKSLMDLMTWLNVNCKEQYGAIEITII